jgi:stress response protein YsnF
MSIYLFGTVVIGDTGEIAPIELRQMSEPEQAVREDTGLPARPVMSHPNGYKKSGPDRKDEVFGPTVKVPEIKPSKIVRRMRKVILKRVETLKKVRKETKAGDVEVYFGFDGMWKPFAVPRISNQFEIESTTGQEFETVLAPRECSEPESHRNDHFRAPCCENRGSAVSVRCT